MLFAIVVSIFLTALCAFIAIYLGLARAQDSPKRELRRRLRYMARKGAPNVPGELGSEIFKERPPLDRFLSRLPLTRHLDKRLDHAGLQLSASVFLAIAAAVMLTGAAIGSSLGHSAWLAPPGAACSALCIVAFLSFKKEQRIEKFTELFPDALSMIARSLRAGHSFNTAIQLVGQEIPNPVGELFKTAYDQQLLGLRITDCLNTLNERIDSLDLRFFTTVVGINTDVGGNLSEILDKLSVTIRERLRIRRQVRVYTAQGRMSGYILGALPLIAFVLFNILNPAYESALLKEKLGLYTLALAGCMQLIGLLVIRKIIKIRI